ncbi:hypothetical protein H1Z67_000112 [Salmonella enterica]|nr:hypothetical protein [Salmonella enterica]
MMNHKENLKIVHCQKCDFYMPRTDGMCPICGTREHLKDKFYDLFAILFGGFLIFIIVGVFISWLGSALISICIFYGVHHTFLSYKKAKANNGYYFTEKTIKKADKLNKNINNIIMTVKVNNAVNDFAIKNKNSEIPSKPVTTPKSKLSQLRPGIIWVDTKKNETIKIRLQHKEGDRTIWRNFILERVLIDEFYEPILIGFDRRYSCERNIKYYNIRSMIYINGKECDKDSFVEILLGYKRNKLTLSKKQQISSSSNNEHSNNFPSISEKQEIHFDRIKGGGMERLYFVYINAKSVIAAYELANVKYNGDYIQGYCPTEGAFRTFRKDRFIKFLDSFEDAIEYLNKTVPTLDINKDEWVKTKSRHHYDSFNLKKPDFKNTFEVCFTGFKKTDKDRLKDSAISAGMIVRSDVTANLHILCCGYNAGTKKMEIATLKGTMVLTENEFLDFLNSGVIPDKYCS